MAEHSLYGASTAHRWMPCPGSVPLSAGRPSTAGADAREGTAAHRVLSVELMEGGADQMLGATLDVDGYDVLVDADMVRHAVAVAGWVEARARELGGTVLVDRRTQYHEALGVDPSEGFGTLDVSIVAPDTLVVIDYKYGANPRGEVHADDGEGGPNPQLALYALGELAEHGDMADFQRVELFIWQPRVSNQPSLYVMPVEELVDWGREHAARAAASVRNAITTFDDYKAGIVSPRNWEPAFLNPGEKQCRFCQAKAICPALRAEGALAVVDYAPATPAEFAEVIVPGKAHLAPTTDEWLDAVFPKLDLIDGWVLAVRAEIERRLLAGAAFTNAKLVQGRQGNRAWVDKTAAEAELKAMRLKIEEMYDLSLISPTTAEKLADAKVIGPRQWKKLQERITRAPGKIHVAPVGDARPAIATAAVALEFEPTDPKAVLEAQLLAPAPDMKGPFKGLAPLIVPAIDEEDMT